MKCSTSFKFETPKKQIEDEINGLKRFWEETVGENKEWNKRYPNEKQKETKEPNTILVSCEIYNNIREIYACNIPFPHDTPTVLGLNIIVMKSKNIDGEIIITYKK